MQTHETKQNSLVGNEMGMSKVHNDKGVETRYQHLQEPGHQKPDEQTKSWGLYFPTDLYAYFLVTNDPFKKERIYPGLPLFQTKETANGKLEDRENHLWQGKEKQNWRRQCD